MSVERIGNGLQFLNEVLGRPALDPDPAREDFRVHQETLDGLVAHIDTELLGPVEAALAELDPEDEHVDQIKNTVADRVGDAAALLFAAQRTREGRRLLLAASELATPGDLRDLLVAGLADPSRFTPTIRAWWLVSQERLDEARALAAVAAEGAPAPVAASLRRIIEAARPIQSPPALFGINGFGLRLYGSRDQRDDGTYVITRYITALFVPLVPLDAYRVMSADDDGWYFQGKVDLSSVARWWRRLALLGVVLAVVGGFVRSYYTSEGYRVQQAVELAEAAESDASPDERRAVVDQYELILTQFPDAHPDDLRPAVAGFVRLSVADIPSPLTLANLGDVERFTLRYRALPKVSRVPSIGGPVVEQLETWASELGTDSDEAVLGALTILGHAEELADSPAKERIRDQRYALNRDLAQGLAEQWPLEAIRQNVSMPDDTESIVAAGTLLQQLGEGPSVWIELGATVTRWRTAAHGIDGLSAVRETVTARVAAAQERVADPERLALLEDPQLEPLKAAVTAAPGDQDLAVALADLQLASGEPEDALATLTDVGTPGHLVLSAQATLAVTYVELDRVTDADALLERVLTSRLPAFESARRSYNEKAEVLQNKLVARAQAGTLPRVVQKRLENAAESEQGRVFAEYVEEQIASDLQLSALRDEYTSLAGVVGIAIQWGTLKLRRASAAEGEERQLLLDGAERAFLAIGHEGTGMPSYHLGLGQVYYRLGKEEEGEQQFQSLLSGHPPEVHIAVASAYRELGLLANAREIAQKVYDTSESPLKQSAASMMAVMATERDDTRMWLQRGDSDAPGVRLRLLELEGEEQLEQGQYDVADNTFAEVAAGWLEHGGGDGSGFNNAAIALLRRYECTGDIERLREAVKVLEKAHGLTPDNALVVGNLGGALETLAMADLLRPYVQLEHLRLTGTDMRALVGAIGDGPRGTALQDAMDKSPNLRRALDYMQQGQVLAPRRPSSYGGLLFWYGLRADREGLDRLGRTLGDVDLDLGDVATAAAEYNDGSSDETTIERMEQRLSHYDVVAQAVGRRGSKASQAALAWLRGQQLHELAVLRRDADVARRAVAEYTTALGRWDGLDQLAHARALIEVALLDATSSSLPMATAYGERRRSHGGEGLVVSLLVEDGEGLTALRARPEVEKAAALRRGLEPDLLRSYDWILGRLSSDASLQAGAEPALDGPRGAVLYEIATHLDPQPETVTATLEYLRAR